MPIASMTGFARENGAATGYAWHWEVRSVNGRGLDVRCRLPPGFDHLESALRAAAAKRLVLTHYVIPGPLGMSAQSLHSKVRASTGMRRRLSASGGAG